MNQQTQGKAISTVFATGEAETAERAFERAHELLWKRLDALQDLELIDVHHETTTRTISEKSLNLQEWTTEIVGEISTVIVSLLATCKYTPGDDQKTPGNEQGEKGHD